jgi:hypothetical protein
LCHKGCIYTYKHISIPRRCGMSQYWLFVILYCKIIKWSNKNKMYSLKLYHVNINHKSNYIIMRVFCFILNCCPVFFLPKAEHGKAFINGSREFSCAFSRLRWLTSLICHNKIPNYLAGIASIGYNVRTIIFTIIIL